VHWFEVAQALVLGSFAVQTPAEHQLPDWQSASVVQLPWQVVAPQAKGEQSWVCSGGQAPPPSQYAASTATLPVQLGARHCTVSFG
jgi:hypothetical protein